MTLYTTSRLKTLRQCPRLHHYRYDLGIQTPSSPAAEFGTVAHAAIEAWLLMWKAGKLASRLEAMLRAVNESSLSDDNKTRLASLLVVYDHRWRDQPWEIIGVEIEFRYELDGNIIGGKIDALIRDTTDGRIWIVEHKTTGQDASLGSTYWQRLAIDTQISIYVDGATVLGHEIAGVIYDVLQRPKHELRTATPIAEREYTQGKGCSKCGGSAGGKKGIAQGRGFYEVVFASEVKRNPCDGCAGTGWKCDDKGKPQAPRLIARHRETDETLDEFGDRLVDEISADPDGYLIRGAVVRLEDDLPDMRTDLIEAIKLERAASLFNLHPRNPDACAKFGSMCHFFSVCSGQASIDDEQRFPRVGAHPELSNAA
jgi:hypothetical protein